MSIYFFRCHVCGEIREFLIANLSDTTELACPSCGRKNLERLISTPKPPKDKANALVTISSDTEEW